MHGQKAIKELARLPGACSRVRTLVRPASDEASGALNARVSSQALSLPLGCACLAARSSGGSILFLLERFQALEQASLTRQGGLASMHFSHCHTSSTGDRTYAAAAGLPLKGAPCRRALRDEGPAARLHLLKLVAPAAELLLLLSRVRYSVASYALAACAATSLRCSSVCGGAAVYVFCCSDA